MRYPENVRKMKILKFTGTALAANVEMWQTEELRRAPETSPW